MSFSARDMSGRRPRLTTVYCKWTFRPCGFPFDCVAGALDIDSLAGSARPFLCSTVSGGLPGSFFTEKISQSPTFLGDSTRWPTYRTFVDSDNCHDSFQCDWPPALKSGFDLSEELNIGRTLQRGHMDIPRRTIEGRCGHSSRSLSNSRNCQTRVICIYSQIQTVETHSCSTPICFRDRRAAVLDSPVCTTYQIISYFRSTFESNHSRFALSWHARKRRPCPIRLGWCE
jgi:hypothetical protein